MTPTRIATTGLVLLIAAAAPLHAQHAAPRWGGPGTRGSGADTRPQTHGHVTYRGPAISTQSPSWGGSWNGARPTYGGSPPEPAPQRGEDLRGFFGYVPPQGQTSDNVPVPTVQRLPADIPGQRRSPITSQSTTRVQATLWRQHHSQITWP